MQIGQKAEASQVIVDPNSVGLQVTMKLMQVIKCGKNCDLSWGKEVNQDWKLMVGGQELSGSERRIYRIVNDILAKMKHPIV